MAIRRVSVSSVQGFTNNASVVARNASAATSTTRNGHHGLGAPNPLASNEPAQMHTNTLSSRRTMLSSFHAFPGNTAATYTSRFSVTSPESNLPPNQCTNVGDDVRSLAFFYAHAKIIAPPTMSIPPT